MEAVRKRDAAAARLAAAETELARVAPPGPPEADGEDPLPTLDGLEAAAAGRQSTVG